MESADRACYGCGKSGHMVRDCPQKRGQAGGVEVDPRKTESIKNRLKPLTHTDIRSFLGLAGYYRRFVEGFSSIVSQLTALTKNKVMFEWTETCEKSLKNLKDRLTSATVLTLPKYGENYTVYCDESRRELNLRQRRWLELLKDYDMNVHYHPGKGNVVADALRRMSMGSTSHIEDEKKDFAKEIEELTLLHNSGDHSKKAWARSKTLHCFSSSDKWSDIVHHSEIGGHVDSVCD
ncbi:uncharacterized protein LOC107025023 [Solanum pennellii]|uniref:Uncharacterized protein LOC107025023 n=1 Tax=Solanum pennellii TaxID=28526 RepID=A0ABM1H7B0_SOLPN|nr:uncharacterized protein LOC107025023 [Solanum pennellii]